MAGTCTSKRAVRVAPISQSLRFAMIHPKTEGATVDAPPRSYATFGLQIFQIPTVERDRLFVWGCRPRGHAAEREREISGRIRLLTHLRRVIARQPMPRARRAIDAGKGTGVVAQGAASPETRNALAVRPHHSHDAA